MKNSRALIANIFGWYGTSAILLAYALVSFSMLKSTDLSYQILNLSGALGLIVLGVIDRVYQAVTLNVVWAIVACVALVKLFL